MDKQRIIKGLQLLNHQSLLAFSLSCLERLYPNFDVFCQSVKLPFSPIYADMLNSIWDELLEPGLNRGQIAKFKQNCLEIIPDSEDYASWLTGLAQDAVCGLSNTLEFMETEEIEHIERVSRNVFDSLYTYLYVVNTPDLGVGIDHGEYESEEFPLNLAEYNKQLNDIEYLKNVEGFSQEEAISFRNQSKGGLLLFERGLFFRQEGIN